MSVNTPILKKGIALSVRINPYRQLLTKYLLPQRRQVVWLYILILLGIFLQLINPQVIRYFLDTAQSGESERALTLAACLFIAFALCQQVLSVIAIYYNQSVSWTATNRLRADVARHCLKLDMSFHKQHTPGEIIERIDGDAQQLYNFFSNFSIRVLANSLLIIGILALLFRENAWVGLGMLVYILATVFVLSLIQRPAVSFWKAERQANAELYGYLEERISGAEEIRACGAEPYAVQHLLGLMRSCLEKTRSAFVMGSLTWNLTNLVYVIGYASGLALGVYLYLSGKATIGTAYLVVFYVGMLSTPLQGIREQVQDFQQASAGIQRIQALLHLQPQVQDPHTPERTLHLPDRALEVEFQDVSFSYAENGSENVLHDISFRLQPGKVLGILGRTGSGKSTLTRLIFRLYDPSEGVVSLGGLDLRGVAISDLRQHVAMVTQEVQLFDTTIRNNLTLFNKEIGDSRLESVLKTLHLWDWVRSLPDGLDTHLAAGGQGLSAGEAQLLAFARAFLKEPSLVILDEASSRLDPVTESLMEGAVGQLFVNRTGIIIAHRLKTVLRADEILILEDGRVVEYGERLQLVADPASRFSSLLKAGLEEVLA